MDLAEINNAKSPVRSCTTCSKAKAKCVKQPGAHICERCARLKKECHSKEPILRRKKPVKTTRAAQLEKLENKIEHLVNALSTTTQPSYQPTTHGQLSPPTSQVSSAQDRSAVRSNAVLESLCGDCGQGAEEPSNTPQGPSTHETQSTTPGINNGDKPRIGVALEEADALLDRYRRLMADGLPFVVVPDGLDAQSMMESRPVLLRAICTVAYYHDLSTQQALVKELVGTIGDRVLMKNEKSIDLLQAILICVAWHHPHIFWSQQITNLLHLGIALMTDMGLDRLSHLQDFKAVTTRAVHGPPLASRIASLEERRVLVGFFYTTSMLSSSFKKLEAIAYTPYMDECLEALEQAREHDSDLFLVQMVRIQRIIENVSTTETPNAPPRMFIKAFQADIERLRKVDPCKEDNIFLTLEYLTAEVLTWELAYVDVQENKNKPLSTHLEDMYHCMLAIKRFLEVYFTIPSSAYLLLPFSVFGQYAHAFICLTKLASLEMDGWDIKSLSDQISFIDIIEQSAIRFEKAGRTVDGALVENDAFGNWSKRVRWMKQVWEAKFAPDVGDGAASQNGLTVDARPPEETGQPTPPDDYLSADFFGYLDEGFWNSFTGDFDYLLPDATLA